jgi:release factor glutamine methyltransferase
VTLATTPTRGALVAELAAVVGAPHEARFIVDEVLGLGLVLGHPDPPSGPLGEETVAAARRLAARRAAGEPLQYVFGHWPFRTLDLLVDPRVLIPRPETEQVVEVALAEARRMHAAAASRASTAARGIVAVDAGTGSGAIALALAAELGPAVLDEVWATDRSADALAVAAGNLEALRARRGGDLGRVTLARGSWLQPLPASRRGAVDLVVSNPPYVAGDEWPELAAEVRAEPRQALVSGPGSDGTAGLACVEAVLTQARDWLARPGVAVVELSPLQAPAAVTLALDLGYDDVRVEPDLAGRSRAVVARLAPAGR